MQIMHGVACQFVRKRKEIRACIHATKIKRKIIPPDQTSKKAHVVVHTFWGHDSVLLMIIVDIRRLGLIDLHGGILLCLGNDQVLFVPLESKKKANKQKHVNISHQRRSLLFSLETFQRCNLDIVAEQTMILFF